MMINDEDVCVSCKRSDKELKNQLINKTKIKKFLNKIKIEPYPEMVLGEIILCIWCQGALYTALEKHDGRFEKVAGILSEVTKQVSILNKILE